MVPPQMSGLYRKLYFAGVLAVFAGLALLRPDLVGGAFRATSASLSGGWMSALKVTLEIILLGAIIALSAKVIPLEADPLSDGLTALAALAFGFLAEFAGTRAGLWTYYTGERPPLWIIPAWPIGALLVGRLSRWASGALSGRLNGALAFRAWCAVFFLIFVPFVYPKLSAAQTAFATALMAFALFAKADEARDSWLLLTGTVCVFWADLWGTTNHCWTYHVSTARGIAFGAFFDSALVLASVKTARAAERALRAPPSAR